MNKVQKHRRYQIIVPKYRNIWQLSIYSYLLFNYFSFLSFHLLYLLTFLLSFYLSFLSIYSSITPIMQWKFYYILYMLYYYHLDESFYGQKNGARCHRTILEGNCVWHLDQQVIHVYIYIYIYVIDFYDLCMHFINLCWRKYFFFIFNISLHCTFTARSKF